MHYDYHFQAQMSSQGFFFWAHGQHLDAFSYMTHFLTQNDPQSNISISRLMRSPGEIANQAQLETLDYEKNRRKRHGANLAHGCWLTNRPKATV